MKTGNNCKPHSPLCYHIVIWIFTLFFPLDLASKINLYKALGTQHLNYHCFLHALFGYLTLFSLFVHCPKSQLHYEVSWKFLQAYYLSFCIELQRDLATGTPISQCWCVHLCPRDWITFVLFCKRAAVETSKAQSRGTMREEVKVMWKKTFHWNINICCSWIRDCSFKTKT